MTDYSRYKKVLATQEGSLLTVTLNRPERLNAIDFGARGEVGLHQELEDVFIEISGDSAVSAVLLTGAGRAFCAGGDVKDMADEGGGMDSRPVGAQIHSARRLFANMLEVEQPIIAAVNGPAMGLGATLALFADVVVMAQEAYIADTHVSVGLVAGDGGAVIWPLLMPLNRAKYYLMTGKRIPGAEAERLGLVNMAVPLPELLPTARGIAEELANGPTWAIRWTKASINKALRERFNSILDTSIALEMLSFATKDHAEAARAFVEKRAPTFTGR
jgi:enoyl-CoA hydratase